MLAVLMGREGLPQGRAELQRARHSGIHLPGVRGARARGAQPACRVGRSRAATGYAADRWIARGAAIVDGVRRTGGST